MANAVSAIDVRVLRRIALLVLRASEDCRSGCPELRNIVSVIDRMKRNIAVGSPFEHGDVRQIALLVRRLNDDADQCAVRYGIVDELRELVGGLARTA